MKANQKIGEKSLIVLGGVLFSALFYKQDAGMNLAIFTMILSLLTYLRNPKVVRSKVWLIGLAGALVGAVSTILYGNTLSVISSIIGLCIISFGSFSCKASLAIGLFHSIYSILGSFVFAILALIEKASQPKSVDDKNRWSWSKLLFYIAVPIVTIGLFFGLYRVSNVQFSELTDKIDLSFISIEWLCFLFLGMLLSYGFFKHQNIRAFKKFDEETLNNLIAKEPSEMDKLLDEKVELNSGLILLGLLNLLILVLNITDVSFMLNSEARTSNVVLSESVHQGIGALVMSIVLAVSILLFYFRGRLNFIKNNTGLKALAITWIAQNVFMTFSTAFRNFQYIDSLGLTYKRIGVIIYLVLTLIGLFYAFKKVVSVKSNWFLVRYTTWTFYAFLVLMPLINWDLVILKSQAKVALLKQEAIQFDYLTQLSPELIPFLSDYAKKTNSEHYKNEANYLIGRFLLDNENNDWRSMNYRDVKVIDYLESKYSKDQLEYLKEKAKNEYWWRH